MHGIPHISHPCSIGAPQPGHSISIPPRKNKNALSPSRDKAFGKTLCGTTLGCRGLADTTAHHPLSRADAVTGIMRPLLLASSFGGKLHGDFHAPHPSALHQTAALFAGTKGVLVLIHAKMFNYRIIIPRFHRLSTSIPAENLFFRRNKRGSRPARSRVFH